MNNKRLKIIIKKMIQNSFSGKGKMIDANVLKNLKLIKRLPTSQALFALNLYQKGLKREIQKTTLDIFTPSPISTPQKNQITKSLGQQNIINQVNVFSDASLLGGLRIKIGDIVYDDTVHNKIGQIKGVING